MPRPCRSIVGRADGVGGADAGVAATAARRVRQEENGDCEPPKEWPPDPGLAAWVAEQRERRRREQLPEERVRRLDELGFAWKTPADVLWDEQFDRLVTYKKQYGNTAVPHNFSEDQKLANWAAYQKERIRKGKVGVLRFYLVRQRIRFS